MGRRAMHDEHTAIALLDAAEDLLARGGPDAVSVRAVAEAANVSTRAVYNLFGGKEGLITHLRDRGYDLLAALVTALPVTDDPAADLVEAGIAGFRTFAITRPHLFRITFERVILEPGSTTVFSPAGSRASEALLTLIRNVPIGNRPVAVVAFQFHSLCQGLATSELHARKPPIGSDFWPNVPGVGKPEIWRDALTAYVQGLTLAVDRRAEVIQQTLAAPLAVGNHPAPASSPPKAARTRRLGADQDRAGRRPPRGSPTG
ncbi:MAG: TetR/AcrR family transcriptional regulator [Mycobacteriales bacterium]